MSLLAQLHASGPAHVWIGPMAGRGGTIRYFGTTAESPVIMTQKAYEGVPNDIGGQKLPFGLSYQGQNAFIGLDFTRWSNVAENWVNQFPHTTFGPAAPDGVDLAGDIGALVETELLGFQLWLGMPYAAKAAMLGDPIGVRFVCASPVGEPIKTKIGTGHKRFNVNFVATRIYTPNDGAQTLFDHNMAGLPPIE